MQLACSLIRSAPPRRQELKRRPLRSCRVLGFRAWGSGFQGCTMAENMLIPRGWWFLVLLMGFVHQHLERLNVCLELIWYTCHLSSPKPERPENLHSKP